jgi:hypothetical protein
MTTNTLVWIWEIASGAAFIVLTVVAWARGWGVKALLPAGLAVMASVAGGFLQEMLGLPRIEPFHAMILFMPWDLIVIGILAWMVSYPPVPRNESGSQAQS